MDKDLESYYEERFSMTASKGWQHLMEEVEKMIDSVRDIMNVGGSVSVDFRKGQLDILLWMKHLRGSAEVAHKGLQEEATDESV